MANFFTDAATWLGSQGNLVLPLILTLWIAWGDLKTHRIPNYLTLGTALCGLAYQLAFHGWAGLTNGLLGLALGFGLLLLPYVMGGMGAGDVKALAALGAWLGPRGTLFLFCYMGIAGGLLALGVLWWKGLLWQKIRTAWVMLVNAILSRPDGVEAPDVSGQGTKGIPYGVAIALGMVMLLWRGE